MPAGFGSVVIAPVGDHIAATVPVLGAVMRPMHVPAELMPIAMLCVVPAGTASGTGPTPGSCRMARVIDWYWKSPEICPAALIRWITHGGMDATCSTVK
ncbi:MAG: hypothetical protein ACKOTD_05190, partial [Phycisphaerales bacterium]